MKYERSITLIFFALLIAMCAVALTRLTVAPRFSSAVLSARDNRAVWLDDPNEFVMQRVGLRCVNPSANGSEGVKRLCAQIR